MWNSTKFGQILVGFTLVALAAISRTFGDGPYLQGDPRGQPVMPYPTMMTAQVCPAPQSAPVCPAPQLAPVCPAPQLAPVCPAPQLAPVCPAPQPAPAAETPTVAPPKPLQVPAANPPPPLPLPPVTPPPQIKATVAPPRAPQPAPAKVAVKAPCAPQPTLAPPRRHAMESTAAVGASAIIIGGGCELAPCCCDDAQICVTVPVAEVCFNEAGLRAFSQLMRSVAIRGVENATARGFDSTSAAPGCKGCTPAKK